MNGASVLVCFFQEKCPRAAAVTISETDLQPDVHLLLPRGMADPFRFPGGMLSIIWWFCCHFQVTVPCFALPRGSWSFFVLSLCFCCFAFFFFLPALGRFVSLCSPAVDNMCSINRKKKATGVPTSLYFPLLPLSFETILLAPNRATLIIKFSLKLWYTRVF